jgi:hypothetical protein
MMPRLARNMTVRPISLVWVAAESLLLERGPTAGPRGVCPSGPGPGRPSSLQARAIMSHFINSVGRLAGQTIGSEARVGGLAHLGSGPVREPTFFCFCIAELYLALLV